MKHSFLHRTFSIALSIVVVFSTLSLTIEQHFCGDFLIDAALFSEVKKCDSEAGVKKPCCKDEVQLVDTIDDFALTHFEDLKLNQQYVVVAFCVVNFQVFEASSKASISYKHYKPPNLFKDFQILHDTFLI